MKTFTSKLNLTNNIYSILFYLPVMATNELETFLRHKVYWSCRFTFESPK